MTRPAPHQPAPTQRQARPASLGLAFGRQTEESATPRWLERICSVGLLAAVALAMVMAASEAQAQARQLDTQERIELINENIANPPRIDSEQLRPAQPVQASATPYAAVSTYVRQLEQYANSANASGTGNRPADAKSPAEAAWLLGLMHLHGVGTGLNPARAREWFQHAQRLRYPLSSAGLAWCYLDGCGQQPEPDAAQPWIGQLRKVDSGRALFLEWTLQQLVAPLQVATPARPDVQARAPNALLLRAVKAGDTYAENELGIHFAETGNLAEAKRLFQLAAKESPAAQANVGWVDRHRAQSSVIPSPSAGAHGQDTFLRARQFHRGDGVPVNYGEALRLYRQAAAQGNRFAQKMLALIYTRPTPTGDINIVWMQQLAAVDVTKDGGASMLEPPPSPSLQHDATPLFDYLPARLRTASAE